MTVSKRLIAGLLALAVVLGGVLVLRPTETTLAAWSDEVTVDLPALHTGGVRMDVTPAAGTGSSATLGMSGDAAGTWRPSAVRVLLDGRALTGAELAGSTIEYRVAGSGGTCSPPTPATYTARPSGSATSFPVTGGADLNGRRTLCLTFTPSDQVRIQLGGRALSVTTAIEGVAAGSTWTAASEWAATQQLPAAPTVSAPTCTAGFLNQSVSLGWDWDRAGLSQDVRRWSVQVEDRGTWREVDSLSAGSRSARISPYDSGFVNFSTYTLRVAAVLPDGTSIPAPAGTQVRIERIGIGAAYCA